MHDGMILTRFVEAVLHAVDSGVCVAMNGGCIHLWDEEHPLPETEATPLATPSTKEVLSFSSPDFLP